MVKEESLENGKDKFKGESVFKILESKSSIKEISELKSLNSLI